MIENVHERRVAASADRVGELLETWGSDHDKIWRTDVSEPTFLDPFDVLAGEPVVFDVVAKGDGAEAGVAPGPGEDLLLFAVSGTFGGSLRGEGAGRACPALGVAVAGDEALLAIAGDPGLHPRHVYLLGAVSAQCPRTLPKSSEG